MKAISVVIPNWNGERQLKKNLPLLFNVLAKFNGKSEVIIIDDASADNSVKIIQNEKRKIQNGNVKPKITLFENRKNLGFAKSVNKGVKAAQYNVVFLLNTDVEVKEGCFDYLLPYFNKKDVFAVGANADWKLGIGRFVDCYLDISLPKKISPKIKKPQESFWVSGGHSAFSRKKWLTLGGIDPLYAPFYFEETDLCYRAWKRGWKVLWEPRARVLHKHEESVIKKHFNRRYINFISQRNQLIFIWKNITDSQMITEHKRALWRRIKKNPGYLRVVLAAAARLPMILKRRRQEKREACVGDKEIFQKFSFIS